MKVFFCTLLVLVVVACSVREGLGAVQFVVPPSGSTIAGFEGAVNVTTITCNIVNDDGNRASTQWSTVNFRGASGSRVIDDNLAPELFLFSGDPVPSVPTLTYRNMLTLLSLSPDLDRVTIFCGTGINPNQANVTIRIYRSPILRDNFLVRIEEGSENVPVDLGLDPAAFPEPTDFTWNVNGQPLTLPRTYSRVNFFTIRRSNTGNYTVFTANYLLDDPTLQIGNDTGSFFLDVLYPPSFVTEGPTQHYVLLGDSLSLVCGTGLDSNPQAIITWTAPDQSTIMDNARYDIDNGPDIVRLNFTNTVMSDTGIWRCNVIVRSERYIVSRGRLVLQDEAMIGSISVNIQLIIIATPSQPSALALDNVGATWARISWTAPLMADSPISRYEIIAREIDGSGVVTGTTTTTATFFNVTGLLPATTYMLTVVAISEGGDVTAKSPESESTTLTTRVTVPDLMCSEPVSMDGIIRVSWFYVHTGGLPLTGASVDYNYMNASSLVTEPIPTSDIDVNTTIIEVTNLVAGFSYTFMITAENLNGSSSVSCRSILHVIGVPVMPEVGALMSGPDIGQVTLLIQTAASGVNNSLQGFHFIITPVQDGQTLDSIQYFFPDYQSGTSVPISVSGLDEGKDYSFCVTAVNVFGTSESTKSASVFAGGPTLATAHNIGSIIGGVIGSLCVIIIVTMIVIIVVIVVVTFSRKGEAAISNNAEVVYEDPDRIQQYVQKNDQVIELKECPAYGEREKRQNIELTDCPAYGIV